MKVCEPVHLTTVPLIRAGIAVQLAQILLTIVKRYGPTHDAVFLLKDVVAWSGEPAITDVMILHSG